MGLTESMYGWRGRLGILIGGANRVVESELPELLTQGVACHFTRLPYTEISMKGVEEMLRALESSAELLAGPGNSAGVDAIGFAHATASSTAPGADQEIARRITRVGNVPATTILTAVVDALRHLRVERVAVALPYTREERNAQLRSFLEGNGIRVERVLGGPYIAGHEVSSQPPSSAYRLLRQADSPDSDAVVMTIPNFRTVEVLETLEKDLGKPVVTGNQALAWRLTRLLGINDTIRGFGKLMAS